MAALTVRMCGDEMTPPGDVRRGRWCSGCRGGVQSAVTSAMAVRVEDSSTMALSAAKAATRACRARLLTARGSRGWFGGSTRRRRRRTARRRVRPAPGGDAGSCRYLCRSWAAWRIGVRCAGRARRARRVSSVAAGWVGRRAGTRTGWTSRGHDLSSLKGWGSVKTLATRDFADFRPPCRRHRVRTGVRRSARSVSEDERS